MLLRIAAIWLLFSPLAACGTKSGKWANDKENQNQQPTTESGENDAEPSQPVESDSAGESKIEFTLHDFALVDQIGELQVFENKKQSSNKKSVKYVVLPSIEIRGGQFAPAMDIKKYTSGGDLKGIRLYYRFNWAAGVEDGKAFNKKYGTDRKNMIYEGAIGSNASFDLIIEGVKVDTVTLDGFFSVSDRTLTVKADDARMPAIDKMFETESEVTINWKYKTQESGITYNLSSEVALPLKNEDIKRTLIAE